MSIRNTVASPLNTPLSDRALLKQVPASGPAAGTEKGRVAVAAATTDVLRGTVKSLAGALAWTRPTPVQTGPSTGHPDAVPAPPPPAVDPAKFGPIAALGEVASLIPGMGGPLMPGQRPAIDPSMRPAGLAQADGLLALVDETKQRNAPSLTEPAAENGTPQNGLNDGRMRSAIDAYTYSKGDPRSRAGVNPTAVLDHTSNLIGTAGWLGTIVQAGVVATAAAGGTVGPGAAVAAAITASPGFLLAGVGAGAYQTTRWLDDLTGIGDAVVDFLVEQTTTVGDTAEPGESAGVSDAAAGVEPAKKDDGTPAAGTPAPAPDGPSANPGAEGDVVLDPIARQVLAQVKAMLGVDLPPATPTGTDLISQPLAGKVARPHDRDSLDVRVAVDRSTVSNPGSGEDGSGTGSGGSGVATGVVVPAGAGVKDPPKTDGPDSTGNGPGRPGGNK